MKVATSLPITQFDELGLPSLLSSVSGEIDVPHGKPTASNERSEDGLSLPKEPTSFDTVLAAFGIVVNDPPQPPTPTPTNATDANDDIVMPVSLEPASIRIVRPVNQPILPEPLANLSLPTAQQLVAETATRIDVPANAPLEPSETMPLAKKASSDQILLNVVNAVSQQPFPPINELDIRRNSAPQTTPGSRLTRVLPTTPVLRGTTESQVVEGIRSAPDSGPTSDIQTAPDVRGNRDLQTASELRTASSSQAGSGLRLTPDFTPTTDGSAVSDIRKTSEVHATLPIQVADKIPVHMPDATPPSFASVKNEVIPTETEPSDQTRPAFVQQDPIQQSRSPVQTPDQRPASDQNFAVVPSATALEKSSIVEGSLGTTKNHGTRSEAASEEPLRQRRLKSAAVINLESPDQSTYRPDPVLHSHHQIETNRLADQLAAGLRMHDEDLSAGRPIELRLRLDPPELGTVRVHLRLADDVVSVRLIAGDEAASRMLQSQLPDLRQSLAERGLAFAQCDVHCDSGRQQQSAFGNDSDVPFPISAQSSANGWSRPSSANHHALARSERLDVLA